MMHRGLATLAGALMICFLLLTAFEPQFFLLHFYQSLIYLLVILMLFYFEDHWAYAIGIIAPALWILLELGLGVLSSAIQQVPSQLSRLFGGVTPGNEVAMMRVIIALLCVAMIVFNVQRWKREFMGMQKEKSILIGSFLVVVAYYAILVAWFWNLIPREAAT
jgi:hypothetical protein